MAPKLSDQDGGNGGLRTSWVKKTLVISMPGLYIEPQEAYSETSKIRHHSSH